VLRHALLAITYVRLGRLHPNPDMISRGQQSYVQTLRLLKNSLNDPVMAKHDHTLGAARCMVLYESSESTSGDMEAWQNHVLGLGRLIEHRGPSLHWSPLSRSVFESGRFLVMIVCLMRRQSSFLAAPEWSFQPWDDSKKELDQRLYDHGFLLANLFKQAEHGDLQQTMPQILTSIREGYHGLHELNEELMEDGRRRRLNTAQDAHAALFGETTFALTSILIIALDLTYSIFASALINHCPPTTLQACADTINEIRGYADQARRLRLAKEILRHLQICIAQNSLEFMRPRILFPLNVVRWELRDCPVESAQAQAIFQDVSEKSKFRIAHEVHAAGKNTLPTLVRAQADESKACVLAPLMDETRVY
jgi:hypothetical protein